MPKGNPQDYVTIRQAVSLFPTRPHVGTLKRWMTRGVYGVRLQSVKFGQKRLTRPVWVHEFIDRTIKATPDVFADTSATATSHQAAVKELREMGV